VVEVLGRPLYSSWLFLPSQEFPTAPGASHNTANLNSLVPFLLRIVFEASSIMEMNSSLRSLFTSYQTGANQVKTFLNFTGNDRKDLELVYEYPEKENNKPIQRSLKKAPSLPPISDTEKQKPKDTCVFEAFKNIANSWDDIKRVGLKFQSPKSFKANDVPWPKSQIRKQLKKLRKEQLRKKKQTL